MKLLSFVIGSAASGKTYFIEHHFANSDAAVLNVYDYQQKAYDDAGYGHMLSVPFDVEFRILKKANDMHLHDIIEQLKQGKNVVAEQTFFKAKRRIAYIDEIRKFYYFGRLAIFRRKSLQMMSACLRFCSLSEDQTAYLLYS